MSFPFPRLLFTRLSAIVLALVAAPLAARDDAAPPVSAELHRLGVASPYRLPHAARAGTIRYRLQTTPRWYWPETGEQHVSPAGATDWLTLCADCGREAPPGADALARLRLPTPWLPVDDPVLRAQARRAGRGTVEQRMRRLVALVRERIDGPIEYSDYLDGRAAFDARRGDCTEHALLLATLARAAGLPARVVAGAAYGSRFTGRPHAFGPHMWVQVWDGERWRSHDSGLAGFDAGYLALAVSGDGSPESLRGALATMRGMRIVEAEGLRAAR